MGSVQASYSQIASILESHHAEVEPPVIKSGHLLVPDDIKVEIADSFRSEAAHDGFVVVPSGKPVTIRIDQYHTRNAFARVMLGVLNRPDHIKATVTLGRHRADVSDSAHMTFTTIHTVARGIGSEAADQVAVFLYRATRKGGG